MRKRKTKVLPIFQKRDVYKPFRYPEAYRHWLEHERMHWLAREVPLHEDVRDWNTKLDKYDRDFLTNVFLLFTQGDVDVSAGYVEDYLPHFKHPELRMMLLSYAARETVHIDAYSYLNETLGKPDSFYEEFKNIPVMRDKHEYLEKYILYGKKDASKLPIKIAGISAFTEGMFLFSSFVMLMNYPRQSLMKGMGQIITWSVLDEQKHVEGLTYILKEIIKEDPSLWDDAAKDEIYATAELMGSLELDFIDYTYGDQEEIRGLSKQKLRDFIKFTVDYRLENMGLNPVYGVSVNPLPWFDQLINAQNHENFFETRATSYAKGALSGSWSNVWGRYEG